MKKPDATSAISPEEFLASLPQYRSDDWASAIGDFRSGVRPVYRAGLDGSGLSRGDQTASLWKAKIAKDGHTGYSRSYDDASIKREPDQ